MLNKTLLNNKYKQFIPNMESNEAMFQAFIKDLEDLKQRINFKQVNSRVKPLLIYNNRRENALQYLMCVNYSLNQNKVLNQVSVRAQTFMRQHFADKDRDAQLYDSMYYTDILFLTLTQADYTSEYMETLLQDLLDFRTNRDTHTVIIYEVIDTNDRAYMNYTKKLRQFFQVKQWDIIDLINGIPTQHSATNQTQTNNRVATRSMAQRNGRII